VHFPIPDNKHAVKRFLRTTGYYCKFCYNFSTVAEPLNILLWKQKFVWSTECQHTFEKITSLLLSALALKAPDFEKPFKLQVDVSDIGMVWFCHHDINHSVSYFSQKLNKHQVSYPMTEKETLALLLSLQHFDVYQGSTTKVEVYTDHNPLVFIKKMKNKNQRYSDGALLYRSTI